MALKWFGPAFAACLLAMAFIFGTVFGSFINCMAWRIVHGESILHGRSHCATCGHTLGTGDLIPVFSYLFLRGRCRYCGERISPRYMIVELVTGLSFVAVTLRFGVSFTTLRDMGLVVALIGLSLVDLDSMLIPDRFIVFGCLWWAAFVPLVARDEGGMPWTQQLLSGLAGGLVIGGAVLAVALLFDHVTGKESLGGGDIKLLFMVGLYLGLWGSLFNLILSCLVGLFMALGLGKQKIPFGPAISLASGVSLLFGASFVSWYLGLML